MAIIKQDYGSIGGGVLNLTFNPQKNNNTGFLAFDTSTISHFKGVLNPMSTYSDEPTKFIVGYADNLSFTNTSLINSQAINGADFNVDKAYKFLICLCNDNTVWSRAYDITLTL